MLWHFWGLGGKLTCNISRMTLLYILSSQITNTALKLQWRKYIYKSSFKQDACFIKSLYIKKSSYCILNLPLILFGVTSAATKGERGDYPFVFFPGNKELMNTQENWIYILPIVTTGVNRRRRRKTRVSAETKCWHLDGAMESTVAFRGCFAGWHVLIQ